MLLPHWDVSTPLDIAHAVDRLIHADLHDPFVLNRARLYVVTDEGSQFRILDEDENPYRLLMRTRHHQPFLAGCLVVTGWCAPVDAEASAADDLPPPSRHPDRQRVRVSVAISDLGIATVMRQSSAPHTAQAVTERGTGDLPDVLESWWSGTLR